jgi:hypothetical protein
MVVVKAALLSVEVGLYLLGVSQPWVRKLARKTNPATG